MPTPAEVVAALRNGTPDQDDLPFGVGGPAEPQVPAPAIIGNMVSGAANTVKNLMDQARQFDPNDIQGSTERLIPASTETAMMLAGGGAGAAEKGAAGIFGGRLSKTADLDKMIYAHRYDGVKSPQQIIQETGWFKDPASNKMMYEIPDNTSRVLSHGLDYTQDGNSLTGPASAIVQHPDLWKSYPQLKDINFTNSVYQNPLNGIGTGRFSSRGIEVNAPNLVGAKSVALHELNHGVQIIEGFPYGASPQTFSRLQTHSPNSLPLGEQTSDPLDLYRRTAGEVTSRNVQDRMNMTPEQRLQTPSWQTQDTPYNKQLIISPQQDFVRALRHLK